MTLHEHLMRRFKQTDHRQIVLHYMNTILAILYHFSHLPQKALGFFKINHRFLLFWRHNMVVIPGLTCLRRRARNLNN